MNRDDNEKKEQFERLWSGLTPRGVSFIKRREFRSKMKSACQQLGQRFDKHNSRLYFLGRLNTENEDNKKRSKEKSFRPLRRFLRNI